MESTAKASDLSERASALLSGKVVARVLFPGEGEICVEFEDGTRLFVNGTAASEIDVSIT